MQGEFTKEEAQETIEALSEITDDMTRKKKLNFAGHLNDIFLFLEAAKRAAPEENA